MNTKKLFDQSPLVPVVVINDENQAVPLANALLQAGITAMEITLRTDAALRAIKLVASDCPNIRVGAGSIRANNQIEQVLNAGAEFCVSPGFSNQIIAEAKAQQANLIPGAATAAEALQLMEQEFELVKFFPAEAAGGTNFIKAISAPLPELSFFPTGGISAKNLTEYLALDCVHCVGGSWFVPTDQINAGNFEWIIAESKQALSALTAIV